MADFETHFTCKNGRVVRIEIDDFGPKATVFDVEDREIGAIEFYEIDDPAGAYLKIAWAFLDKLGPQYLRQGIGRRCVEIVRERFGMPIIAEQHDGHQRDDGSHLTGDAPAFIARLRDEGLIV